MKLKVDAEKFRELRDALKRAAPKSLFNATLLEADGAVLRGVTVGDSLYAEYVSQLDEEPEQLGWAVVGNAALAALDQYRGDVHLRLSDSGKTLFMTGTYEHKLRTMEVKPENFSKPDFDGTWLPLPDELRHIMYATGDKNLVEDVVWIEGSHFLCGARLRIAFLDWDQPNEWSVAVRSALVQRAMSASGAEIALGERHVWIRSGHLLTAMPYVERPIFHQYQTVMGLTGVSRCEARTRMRAADFVNALKSLVTFCVSSENPIGTVSLLTVDDTLKLTAFGNQLGSGDAEVSLLEHEGVIDLAGSPVWFIGAMSHYREDDVTLELVSYGVDEDNMTPMWVIRDDGLTHLMSPIRIQDAR